MRGLDPAAVERVSELVRSVRSALAPGGGEGPDGADGAECREGVDGREGADGRGTGALT